jgi:phage terminase Nu1 subunit (DNA packaging protein)
MTLNEKIKELSTLNKNKLSFIQYEVTGWEVHSYADDSPLSHERKYPRLNDTDFETLINKALAYTKNELKRTEAQ